MSKELDAAIMEALGFDVYTVKEEFAVHGSDRGPFYQVAYYYLRETGREDCGRPFKVPHLVPHLSSDPGAMLWLDKKMQERGFGLSLARGGSLVVADYIGRVGDPHPIKHHEASADTEPLARALAAYKALTGRSWDEREGGLESTAVAREGRKAAARGSDRIYVYISGPYSKGDVALNVRQAIETADKLLNLGFVPYVPHLTHFWHFLFPRPYEEWLRFDECWLVMCDALLRLPGESVGADMEVYKAVKHGIPVFHSVESLIEAFPSAQGNKGRVGK